jgi:hypothetical protein
MPMKHLLASLLQMRAMRMRASHTCEVKAGHASHHAHANITYGLLS